MGEDGSNPATPTRKKYATVNFFTVGAPQKLVDEWRDRYFDPASLASLERQFSLGGHPCRRAPSPGPGMTSG